MGERTDRDVVDARCRDLRGIHEAQAPRGLKPGPAGCSLNRCSHVCRGEVVEEDEVSASGEYLVELLKATPCSPIDWRAYLDAPAKAQLFPHAVLMPIRTGV